MSLPWFPFNIKAYLSDTMRLSTEGHGAYLLLILDYYEADGPAPDDDEVLSDITKLPIDRWKALRPRIAAFFQIRDGFWHHDRIEREKLEATSKHTKAKDKAVKAATASAASRSTSSKPQAKSHENEPSCRLVAHQEAASSEEHKQVHIHPPSGGEAPPPPEANLEDVGSQIDPTFQPVDQARTDAIATGFTSDEFDVEVRKFVATKLANEAFSGNWDASFVVWMEREKAYRAKQAERKHKRQEEKLPARVEVNTVIDWDKYCAFWVKVGRWSRDLGPDPDSSACRCPLEILIKHKLRKEPVS